MRLVTNEPLVKRNATIGRYGSAAGLVVLVGGLIVSFYGRDNPLLQTVPFVTLVIGFLLSNAGIYFTNRYGRNPRADTTLAGALKGFDDRYSLYNYYLPAPHFLITPNAIYSVTAKHQSGVVQWDGKRWKHKNANFFLTFFGQEGLSNPNAEAAADADNVAKYLAQKVGGDIPPVQPLIVFFNDKVEIEGENPPIPALHVKQLKEYLRKTKGGGAKDKDSGGSKEQAVTKEPGTRKTLTNDQVDKLDEALKL